MTPRPRRYFATGGAWLRRAGGFLHLTLLMLAAACGQEAAGTAQKPTSEQPPDAPTAENKSLAVFQQAPPPCQPGEELHYTLKWSGFAAGRVVISVSEHKELQGGRKVLKVSTTSESNAFVSAFFKVRDYTWSLVDAAGGYSHQFYFEKNEGKRHEIEETVCNYTAGRAVFTRRKQGQQEPPTPHEAPLNGPVADPVSAMFYYRLLPSLKLGDVITMPVIGGKKCYDISMKVGGKALIRLRGVGVVKALRLEPVLAGQEGPVLAKGDSAMYIEETTRIPLRITVDLKFGSITSYLAETRKVPGLKGLTKAEIRQAAQEGYE